MHRRTLVERSEELFSANTAIATRQRKAGCTSKGLGVDSLCSDVSHRIASTMPRARHSAESSQVSRCMSWSRLSFSSFVRFR